MLRVKIHTLLLVSVFIILNGCASQNGTQPSAQQSNSLNTKNKVWSNGFMIIPLKIQKDAPGYQTAKERILKIVQAEVIRDRQNREEAVRSGRNLVGYCELATINIRDRAEKRESMRLCMQVQHRVDMKSLQTSYGKSLEIKKDSTAHYARYRWNLFTHCGTTQKATTRDIYYGFIEPKEKPHEAYMFLTYRTQNECEAVYQRLRRKANRILRKAKRILTKYQVPYTQIHDQF